MADLNVAHADFFKVSFTDVPTCTAVAFDTLAAAATYATVALAVAADDLALAAGAAIASWRNGHSAPLLHVPLGKNKHGTVAFNFGAPFGFAAGSEALPPSFSLPIPFPLDLPSPFPGR